jgi:predicted  nucleic acid-binding Zn-ribbon protein
MSEEATQRDLEIRAAINELSEASENMQRITEEVERWQKENQPPTQPQSVRSMAEVEEYERKNEEWHEPYKQRMERHQQARARLEAASNKVKSLLPPHIAYEYKGRRYRREGNTYRIEDIG